MFDSSRVAAIIQDAMTTILLPARKNIESLNAHEKTPGELVTSADIESQSFLSKELSAICPEAKFLGEETAVGELDMNVLDQHEKLWIVDPLDGTIGYAAGGLSFAILIAFAIKGVVQSAWIATPRQSESGKVGCSLAVATAGQPATLDGEIINVSSPPSHLPKNPKGVVGTKYFAPEMRQIIIDRATKLGSHRGPASAGFDILALAKGEADYLLYSRTLPWDFAAPLFWGSRAGIISRRFSGASVNLKPNLTGLLCARSSDDWQRVQAGVIAYTQHEDLICINISEDKDVTV